MNGQGIQDARLLARSVQSNGVYVGKTPGVVVTQRTEGAHLKLRIAAASILREASRVGGQVVPVVGRDYEIQHLERAFSRVVSRGGWSWCQ